MFKSNKGEKKRIAYERNCKKDMILTKKKIKIGYIPCDKCFTTIMEDEKSKSIIEDYQQI